MHVHLPKPLHGWREFAGEVGIIVLGVLIALGAEQMIEAIHWHREVRTARISLSEDMHQSNGFFAFRVVAHDCIARRLTTVNEIIERAARHDPVPILGEVIPDIGNGLRKNAWETNRAAQTLTHFDRKTLSLYGSYYLGLDNIDQFMLSEAGDWGVLRVLQGDPSRLGPMDIAGLRVAVKHASFENDVIAQISQGELEDSKLLGVGAPETDKSRVAEVCRPL